MEEAKTEIEKAMADPATHRFECKSCGYVYEPEKGEPRKGVPGGTPFAQLAPNWRCPVCNASKKQFFDIGVTGKPSGFSENLGYGFGVNTLTPSQKNLLIFGALLLGFLLFLSGYVLN
ncbi:Rubredoxin-type Fe(Cys)4 protein [Thalassoporum mexicanum PCC 7367]|uniref:rubredoxin n=1 Tax=Thalassoporum mexicanum TaxID=3457544 RepID=UPI00029F9812|nr:rubredoxin [Pseudanabaena sp. PCC 7367]AFY70071.1 Rubredoxin-type Fe(Cys)4 protein [Pseudanabaena sp. PCC 7367]